MNWPYPMPSNRCAHLSTAELRRLTTLTLETLAEGESALVCPPVQRTAAGLVSASGKTYPLHHELTGPVRRIVSPTVWMERDPAQEVMVAELARREAAGETE